MPKQKLKKTGIKLSNTEFKPLSNTVGYTKDAKPEQTLFKAEINKNRLRHDVAVSKIRDQIFSGEISEQLTDKTEIKPVEVS